MKIEEALLAGAFGALVIGELRDGEPLLALAITLVAGALGGLMFWLIARRWGR